MTLDSMRCRMTERGVGRTVRDGEAGLRLDTLLPSERGTIPQAVAPPQRISLQKSTLRQRQATAACGRRDLDTCRESRRARLTIAGPAIYGERLADPTRRLGTRTLARPGSSSELVGRSVRRARARASITSRGKCPAKRERAPPQTKRRQRGCPRSLLLRTLPRGNGELSHPRDRELAGWCVLGERGPGGERRAAPYAHRRDQLGIRTDEDIVLDDRPVLVRAVIIARDRAGADVDPAADRRIADVGQVVRLRAGADLARLDLDEVADVDFLGEPDAGAEAGVGTDAAPLSDARFLQMAERLDSGIGFDAHVPEHTVRADRHAVPQHDFA